MDRKQAIEIFKSRLEISDYEKQIPEYYQAMRMAVEALEKQIPKKPTSIDYKKYIDTVQNALYLKGAYWCPNCEHVVKCGTYCRNCGQKLDWSEEE